MNRWFSREDTEERLDNIDELLGSLNFPDSMDKIKLQIIGQLLHDDNVKRVCDWAKDNIVSSLDKELADKVANYIKPNSTAVYKLWNSYKIHDIFAAVSKKDFLDAFLEYAPSPWKVNLPFYSWDEEILSNYIRIKYQAAYCKEDAIQDEETKNPIGTKYIKDAVAKYKYRCNDLGRGDLKKIVDDCLCDIYILDIFLTEIYKKKQKYSYKVVFQLFSLNEGDRQLKKKAGRCIYHNDIDYLSDKIEYILDINYDLDENDIILICPNLNTKRFFKDDFCLSNELPSKYCLRLIDSEWLEILCGEPQGLEQSNLNRRIFYDNYKKARKLIFGYLKILQKNKIDIDTQYIQKIYSAFIRNSDNEIRTNKNKKSQK